MNDEEREQIINENNNAQDILIGLLNFFCLDLAKYIQEIIVFTESSPLISTKTIIHYQPYL